MNGKLKYWDDFLNPVLVKEVRQFFHNKVFLTLVAGLLGLQLLMLFIFNLTFSQWRDSGEAGTVFVVIDTILMYLCVLVTAVWNPMQQFAMERSSKELDFSNITLLTPWQIISGKLASSLVMWGLIAVLCLPFMTVAYFFRNVTLGEILLIFGAGIMPTLVLIQGALFCGTVGKKWVFGLFIYFGCQVIAPGTFIGLIPLLEKHGGAVTVFWSFQLGWGLLFALLLAATVAMVTPPFANKMLPLRILLALCLLPVLLLLPFAEKLPEIANVLVCYTAAGIVGAFAYLAACDRDEPGERVLAQVPANPVGRLLHSLFSSNRRGGMVLALIMLLILGAVTLLLGLDGKRSVLPIAFGMAGYAVIYAELAIGINRRIPALPGWAALPVVAFVVGVLPLMAAANSDISISEIIISPASLLEGGKRAALAPAIWIAPMTAWLIGIIFVVDMIVHYKYYKAPGKEEFEKEYENHDPHL